MKLTKKLILKKLSENSKEIRSFGVKNLVLFGSYASGDQKKDSDVDFLVDFDKGRGLFDDYTDLLHFLENLFDKKIDLVKPQLVREELKESILEGEQYAAKI